MDKSSLVQQKYQQSMSKCHFPHDNHTVILDLPSLAHIQLRLIQTNLALPEPSFFSLTNLEQPQTSTRLIRTTEIEEDSLGLTLRELQEQEGASKIKKKGGCTCKKTNCIKMYCECFSIGKMCTPECACYGCYNHHEHQSLLEKAKLKSLGSNRHHSRGCNCRKTNCQKKYCECFNAGLPCTELCNCCECCNREGETESPGGSQSSPSLH